MTLGADIRTANGSDVGAGAAGDLAAGEAVDLAESGDSCSVDWFPGTAAGMTGVDPARMLGGAAIRAAAAPDGDAGPAGDVAVGRSR